jgi:photosystem II stability/assembly factor-like uncharacterized protein
MNMLEDLPAGPQLRPERAEADKAVMSAAVRGAYPTVRTGLSQRLELGALLKKRTMSRRVAIASVLSAAALALIVALVATLAPQPSRGPQGPVARTGNLPGAAPAWRLVSDVSPSWQAVPSSGDVPGEPKGLNFSCPTATTCYAANFSSKGPGTTSEVEVTDDSGTTWRALTLPASLLRPPSLACVDADTCAILGIDESGNSTFLETTDGGQSWSSHAGPNELTAMNEPMQLACATATSCLVVAAGPNGKVNPGSAVPFVGAASFMTDDGGNTWSTSSLPIGFIPSALQCTSAANCVTSGSISLGGPPLPSQATILYTTDDGTSWATAALPSQLEAQSTFAPSTLSCADTDNCLAIFSDVAGSSSEVLSSTDGGATWAATAATGFPQGVMTSLSCPGGEGCWAAAVSGTSGASATDLGPASGVVASTSDGGATWQQAQLPQGVGVIVDISCPNGSSCYALGLQQVNGNSNVPQPFVLLAYGNAAPGGS